MAKDTNKVTAAYEWSGERDMQRLFARAQAVSPGGVHSPVRAFRGVDMTPIFFSAAEGARLRAVDGKEYIDFCMSFGPLILGHRDPELTREIHRMLDTAWTFGAPEPYSLELAEWIQQNIPWVEKIRFVCSGTEAVMSALRVVRAATGRQKVLKFTGCYHGHLDALLVKAGSGLAGTSASSSAGVSQELVHNTVVAPLDDEATLSRIFAEHGHEIGVLALEPLPANYGLLPQRREFLLHAVAEARKAGALVLFDEVISGFRIAQGGMAEVLGVTPDIVCYGKVIGGGFPVGAYGGKRELMALVAPEGPVYQAGTLAANPIGMRAGLLVLQRLFAEGAWEKLQRNAESFYQKLRSGMAQIGEGTKLTTYGSLFWFHRGNQEILRTPDQIPAEHANWYRKFYRACLARGIYLPPNAYEVNFLSLAHDQEILEQVTASFLEALAAAEK